MTGSERSKLAAGALFRLLLPDFVAVNEGPLQDNEDGLWAQELELIKEAVPERRCEFATGRNQARKALANLGVVPSAILQAAGGAPLWPQGFVGSITHCKNFCAVAVMREADGSAIGIDVENIGRLSAEAIKHVASEDEIGRFLAPVGAQEMQRRATLLFSAKEALLKANVNYKCAAALSRQMSEFELEIDIDRGTFSTLFAARGSGSFLFSGDLVAAAWLL